MKPAVLDGLQHLVGLEEVERVVLIFTYFTVPALSMTK